MNTAILAAIFYFIYSFSLGASAVLAYRYSQSPWRWVPGAFVVIYYVLALLYPHRVIKEALAGTPAPGDDWRFIVSCLAFSTCLYLMAQVLRGVPRDHREPH